MNYKVSLFYNYYTFGDVLMALIDKDAFPTHHYRDNDIVFIYSNEKLIGVKHTFILNILNVPITFITIGTMVPAIISRTLKSSSLKTLPSGSIPVAIKTRPDASAI